MKFLETTFIEMLDSVPWWAIVIPYLVITMFLTNSATPAGHYLIMIPTGIFVACYLGFKVAVRAKKETK